MDRNEESFAQKIKKLMDAKDANIKDVASACGVSRQSVMKWRSGESSPGYDHIKRLCKYFKISADYLFYDDIDPKTLELFEVCYALNEAGQDILTNTGKSLLTYHHK